MKITHKLNKRSFNVFFFYLLFTGSPYGNCQQAKQPAFYAAKEVREDFHYLYTTLQQNHYNLFVNTPKKEYDQAYRELEGKIKDHMSLIEVNRLFQPFIALSGLAHCSIAFPFRPAYLDYLKQGGKVFPLDIAVNHEQVYVTDNYSKDPTIKAGDEIITINSRPTLYTLDQLYNYLSGENKAFKNTLIDLYNFSRLYWLVFGRADHFKLRLKRPDRSSYEILLAGIPAKKLEEHAGKKKSIFHSGREFKWIGKVAYLHPGAFMNTESDENTSDHRTFENSSFVRFIDSAFRQVRRAGTTQLIIDLRGNPGGDNSFSDHMLAYFARQPFSFCSSFSVKTSALTKSFWRDVTDTALAALKQQIMTQPDGTIFQTKIIKHQPVPDSLRYSGKVYVLIDRYSYSNAVTTAATIQDYHWGLLAGERTSDVPTTYAAIHEFKLPHTGMEVSYPKAFIVRPNGDRSARVLEPDLQLKEPMLEGMLLYIKKHNE
ncbi:S41 family peptidase [Mucilaginibacter sp. KACC 22063]|uniref:S41 family peptidase n=1 Tax=Mucilaginibacter sp. KACC 22063 TaxID=3025666 RepID=UPI00236528B4|nr:S41 family peptidase [Mucilaginibacter sp. KACC 22063]WDF57177.1 S41 family peptidase [Mucilaginibacter sp. KACC 22063]